MKTFKTNKGIEFDVEVISIFNGNSESTIEILATCQTGYKSFDISIKNYGESIQVFPESEIEESDLSDVFKWVDSETIAYLSSELAKACVIRSNEQFYYQFNAHYANFIYFSITKMKINEMVYIADHCGYFDAIGEDEIIELIRKLKNNEI